LLGYFSIEYFLQAISWHFYPILIIHLVSLTVIYGAFDIKDLTDRKTKIQ